MREIDYDNWERRQAYEFFSGISHPFYAVSFRQDVTGLYRCAKRQGISMEVNHRFIDGYHIGRFAQNLEQCINSLGGIRE